MSVLEIILYSIIGIAVIYLIISTIYEIKHPEKTKQKLEQRKAKKEQKKKAKEQKNRTTSDEY